MRVRNIGLSVLALGILIGAGGCSSESPTSPLAPGGVSAAKGGYIGAGSRTDSTSVSTQGGGYIGAGSRRDPTSPSIQGGYIGAGS